MNRFDDKVWEEQVRRYEDGVPASQIGRDLGVSTSSVTYQIKKRGITLRAAIEVRKSVVQQRHLEGGLKLCPKCENPKPLSAFPIDRSKSDGLHHLCRTCLKARSDEYRRNRTPGQIRSRKATEKKYRESERGRELAKGHSRKSTRSVSGRFSGSRSRAIRGGKTWMLTKEEYRELLSKSCEYCSGPLPETSTGLDRLDNKKGYSLDNVVPCCTLCNYARRDQFTPQEMRKFIGPAIKAVREARAKEVLNG